MALPEERKEKLKALLTNVIDDDVLNEMDALAIVQVCIDACEREKAAAYEDVLKNMIEDGTDAGAQ